MSPAASEGTDAAGAASAPSGDPRSFAEKRHDQLTSAPAAEESDADPRIDVSTTEDGNTRIDWREDAKIKPGEWADGDDQPASASSNDSP